ncbi:hypothetical protein [Saccharothrix obliqua]|uniref:hypothetical protein n=1 Tax=Saccharothrix obliqua TaxID=2861747 RepID=UPI001C6023D9|nr:hypothetical protein [Saccharothrix obliqua]MBW4717520.1 hypothetical protein [Saccharothrix obliqua]
MAPESLNTRAEKLLNRLVQVREHEQVAGARDAIEQVKARVRQRREALLEIAQAVPELRERGVAVPAAAEPAAGALSKAKSTLRSAASAVVGNDLAAIVERIKAESLDKALVVADKIAKTSVVKLNTAVDERRRQLLPEGLDRKVTPYPGVSESLVFRLEQAQSTLKATVDGVRAADLAKRLDKIVVAVETWERDRPELERALEDNHPEIKVFLREAAGDGAPWHLITPRVREWLGDPQNTASLKVVLRP